MNYDKWFDYIKMEESIANNEEKIRDAYERAIANVPPPYAEGKHYWQRYIYLWINYALFEELDAADVKRARDVYRLCLRRIPHKKFSFAKIWLLAAQFEIRQMNLKEARQILGRAIGMAPKDKIFQKYIEIELQLGNMDRVRKLYEKYLEWAPHNCYAWSKFAELETSLRETDRARAIFELAVAQPVLDMPELLWKAYIDFEISGNEFERTRELYRRLLNRTKHPKVWISYAKFEASTVEDDGIKRVRRIFEEAINYYGTSTSEMRGERGILLEEWKSIEASFGEHGDVSSVQSKMPKKLKKKRTVVTEDGSTSFEEYIDYFYAEESHTTSMKILEAAYNWKRQKVASG